MSDEPSTSSSDSHKQIEVLQGLLEKILQVQKENQNTDTALEQIQEIIQESSKVVENSTSANEMIVDAKILHTGSHFVNTNVSTLNSNLTSFSEPTYVQGLLTYLENSNQAVLSTGMEWDSFAPLTYHCFRKSHPLTFMLGTVTLEPPPPKEKVKVERQKKKVESDKKVLTSITENRQKEEEESDVYKHILKCLVREYKRKKMTPVSYFNFIIDPSNYWRTVENIFYFAFLVRDGSVKMKLKDGLPVVEPLLEKAQSQTVKKTNFQFCFTLSVSQWEECIKRFQVKSASIPPFVKKC